MQKLYAYIDETGLDNQTDVFIVGILIFEQHRQETIEHRLHHIEQQSRKHTRKWTNAKHPYRIDYIQRLFALSDMQNTLHYGMFHKDGTPFLDLVVSATCAAIDNVGTYPYKATVYIDGLQRDLRQSTTVKLRQGNPNIKKVRGVKKDENSAFIRLADALCGLVRLSRTKPEALKLLNSGVKKGIVKQN